MNEMFEQIIAGIILVEKEFSEESVEDKKKKAIDIINKMVDVPVMPEFMEEKILGIVVDLVLYILKEYKHEDIQVVEITE